MALLKKTLGSIIITKHKSTEKELSCSSMNTYMSEAQKQGNNGVG
jgi:hypothetical protein